MLSLTLSAHAQARHATMPSLTPPRQRARLASILVAAAAGLACASAASLPTRGGHTSLPPELESLLAYRSQAGLPPWSALAARAREPSVRPGPVPPPALGSFSAAGKNGGRMRLAPGVVLSLKCAPWPQLPALHPRDPTAA